MCFTRLRTFLWLELAYLWNQNVSCVNIYFDIFLIIQVPHQWFLPIKNITVRSCLFFSDTSLITLISRFLFGIGNIIFFDSAVLCIFLKKDFKILIIFLFFFHEITWAVNLNRSIMYKLKLGHNLNVIYSIHKIFLNKVIFIT